MINRLFIAAVILCLLPAATAFGQELRKEKLIGTNPDNPGSNYAVFYFYGMSESAVWSLGMKLLVKNADGTNGSTIRHTHDKGNGENIAVNDKVPFRFIIAPTDGSSGTENWAAAMGINTSANSNLDQDGTATASGCAGYSTTEFPSGWRLPTQREMMLMWLFKAGIDIIYSGGKLSANPYWTATERTGTEAWYLDFTTAAPQSNFAAKTSPYKYRCVRDY
ncbi:MAG: DUF1566 domain-containing protein [Parabacteroides gordonii]|uniref:DUF1566 domain-containing protein n=1 Tax=Parabacteroides gordonii TaxID=574930 RepID=UPI003A878666